jgi:hypothetical protein
MGDSYHFGSLSNNSVNEIHAQLLLQNNAPNSSLYPIFLDDPQLSEFTGSSTSNDLFSYDMGMNFICSIQLAYVYVAGQRNSEAPDTVNGGVCYTIHIWYNNNIQLDHRI